MYKIQEIAYTETRYVNVSSKRVGKTGIVRRDWGEQEGEESRGVQSLDREGRGKRQRCGTMFTIFGAGPGKLGAANARQSSAGGSLPTTVEDSLVIWPRRAESHVLEKASNARLRHTGPRPQLQRTGPLSAHSHCP